MSGALCWLAGQGAWVLPLAVVLTGGWGFYHEIVARGCDWKAGRLERRAKAAPTASDATVLRTRARTLRTRAAAHRGDFKTLPLALFALSLLALGLRVFGLWPGAGAC